MGLLEGLVDEAYGRFREYSTGPRWTLGACIRRISIAFDSETKRTRSEPTSWTTSRRKNHKAVKYHQTHMNALELALQAPLPNLDFLDWWDRIPITPIVTNAIMNSPITRLELHSITPSEDFDIYGSDRERRMTMQKPKWKLRRLVLSLNSDSSNGTTMFTTSILKIAAPTLEELIRTGCMVGNDWESYSFGAEPITFNKLKVLEMRWVLVSDSTILYGLIPGNDEVQLRHLLLEGHNTELGSFFVKRGHIPTSKGINWLDFAIFQDIDLCVAFFSANPQLERFRFENSPPRLADERLIPLFASSFHHLTSLAINWETAELKPASLNSLRTLITLKHLWLSTGDQVLGKFDWLVDHRILRKKLTSLEKLEWLALARDHYPNGNDHVRYINEPKTQDWKESHRRLMVGHGMNWGRSHPNREWVYFGQTPMSIKRAGNGTGDVIDAVPLMQGRKDCEQLLCEMWGEDATDWVYSR